MHNSHTQSCLKLFKLISYDFSSYFAYKSIKVK